MSTNYKSLYHLLESVLDGGLPVVGSYLEKKIGLPVTITDAIGKIYYPDISNDSHKTEEILVDIPMDFTENSFYNKDLKRLYYNVHHHSCNAYVIVENALPDVIDKAVAIIEESELALKYYFSLMNKKKEDFGESLWEHFFMSAGANVPDLLKLYEKNMDISNYYFISILDVEESTSSLDWNSLRSYVYEAMHRERTEYVSSIITPGRLVTILRGNPPVNPMDVDPDWPGRDIAFETKQSIETRFNISFSQGLGRAHRPSGLMKSYQEACIALALPRLTGQTQFIQYFSQLGVFSIIFSHDIETVKKYCLQVLGKVIHHDQKHGTDFLDTLRILLDNSCSWTTTANQLYVHVNTVYYRMLKVEQLLDVDFSSFETRLHLFTAIRAWDTLRACHFLD